MKSKSTPHFNPSTTSHNHVPTLPAFVTSFCSSNEPCPPPIQPSPSPPPYSDPSFSSAFARSRSSETLHPTAASTQYLQPDLNVSHSYVHPQIPPHLPQFRTLALPKTGTRRSSLYKKAHSRRFQPVRSPIAYYLRPIFCFFPICLLGAICTYWILSQSVQPRTGNYQSKSYLRELVNSNPRYHQSVAVPVDPDGIVLYRILGNDLPPRHKPGQTLLNLRFILENESAFPNCKKWWVLNRIIDPDTETAIIHLLNHHKQEYIKIPFEEQEYMKIDFRINDFPREDFFHSHHFIRFSKIAKLRTIDYTYHDKNLYVMNNNGGRNIALLHGKQQGARWILPFDGNCFLTSKAFEAIMQEVKTSGTTTKYFVVPMARVLNNTNLVVASEEEKPYAPEEPQLMFRNDAKEMFDLNMRYGRRSKLELLWRLGVLEEKLSSSKVIVPWEVQERLVSSDGLSKTGGWVYRLFSGQPNQEQSSKESSTNRAFKRLLAVQRFIDDIDEKIARKTFLHSRLFLYNEDQIMAQRMNYWNGEPQIYKFVQKVLASADLVTSAVAGIPEMVGGMTPDIVLSEPRMLPENSTQPAASHALFISQIYENVTFLALANFFSGDENHARQAANLVRVFVLGEPPISSDLTSSYDPQSTNHSTGDESYTFPTPNKYLRRTPGFMHPIALPKENFLSTIDISFFLDGLRLLRRANALTRREYQSLQALAADYLEYLTNSPFGIHLGQFPDHRGTRYDLQVASLAAFVDDVGLYQRVINRSRMRISRQFTPVGEQPHETHYAATLALRHASHRGSKGKRQRFSDEIVDILTAGNKISAVDLTALLDEHFSTLNLQYWMLLTRGVQNAGIGSDLWAYSTRDGKKLSRALVHHFEALGPLSFISMDVPLQHSSKSLLPSPPAMAPLIYMAKEAHRAADAKRNISHTKGDDHDYLWRFVSALPEKFDFEYNSTASPFCDANVNQRCNLNSAWNGVPPGWQFGLG